MIRSLRTAFAATLVAATTLPVAASAQNVTYTTVSEVELGGALGRLVALGMGDQGTTEETTFLQTPRLRTDTDDASVIWDLEAGRMIQVNHETREFMVLDLAQLREGMTAMAGAMSEEAAQPGMQAEEGEGPRGSLDITVSTDRTGETREIEGLRAERVFLTFEMEGEVPPEDEEGETERSTMVFLMDLWITQDLPQFNPFADDEELRDAMEEAWAGQRQSVSEAFAQSPDVQVGVDAAQAELEALDGTVMEGTTHLVVVPDGVEFDRDKVLEDADKSLAGDAASAVGNAAADEARSAARGIGRRLGGMFGGGGDDEEEEEEPELVQRTLMRVKTLITRVSWDEIAPATFAVPEGYTEVQGGGGGS